MTTLPADVIAQEIMERLERGAALLAQMDAARQRYHERRAEKSEFPVFPVSPLKESP